MNFGEGGDSQDHRSCCSESLLDQDFILQDLNQTEKRPESTWPHNFIMNLNCFLKERFRIGKKQKPWRSQIYIKLTRSNDDDSWKHPLKYFSLKCHIWWEINNVTSHLEFIAQWAFYSFLFWHRCNAKFVIGFSLLSCDPDVRSISNFYRFVILWRIT